MHRVLSYILRISGGVRVKGGVNTLSLSATELQNAKTLLIKYAQKDMVVELSLAADKGRGRYRKLAPRMRIDSLTEDWTTLSVVSGQMDFGQ